MKISIGCSLVEAGSARRNVVRGRAVCVYPCLIAQLAENV